MSPYPDGQNPRMVEEDTADFLRLVSSNRPNRAHRRIRSIEIPGNYPSVPTPPSPSSSSEMSSDMTHELGPPLSKKKSSSPHYSNALSSLDDDNSMRKAVNALVSQRSQHPLPRQRSKDDKIILHHVGESRYALLPDHRLRRYWDTYILILLVYVAFVSVFIYSFYGVLGVDSPWFWIERFLDVSFTFDIVFCFFSAYEKDGLYVKDLPQIRRRYLHRWFVLDVLATIPWDTIALIVNVDKSKPHLLQLPRFIRLLRLFKLFRLLKIFQLQQNFTWVEIKLRLKYGYLRLAGLLSTVIFLSHFFACLFYFFGAIGNPQPDESWTTTIDDPVPDDLYGKYISALYFSVYTITTIGYGDVTPVNTLERTYTVIIMLLGAACFAYVISQVSNIYSEVNASSVHNRIVMDSVIDLQKSRNLPDDLVFNIRRFFKREHLRQRGVTESKLLDGMSRDLRVAVLKHIHGSHLASSRLLSGIPEGHKEDVYVDAKEIFARKDETLFQHGHRADCFYVITRGSVEVSDPTGELGIDPVTLTEGAVFGEADVLFNRKRRETAVCTSYTDLVMVPRSAVMEALERHPEALQKLRDEEAEVLWEEAMWHVEQQIRYNRLARSLRIKAEELMRKRGMNIPTTSSTSASKSPLDLAAIPLATTHVPALTDVSVDAMMAESGYGGDVETGVASMEQLQEASAEKSRRIAELEKRLRDVQNQLGKLVSGLQAV